MTDQKQSDNDPNVNVRMEKRDAETYIALGLFIVAVGIPVILGTYFAYPPNKNVALVVSQGAMATMPDVSSLSESDAEEKLKELGLTVDKGEKRIADIEAEIEKLQGELEEARKVSKEYSATVPAGQVCAQNPPAGASVEADTAIKLTFSKGPAFPVRAPFLKSQPLELATKKIEHAKLKLGNVTEKFDDRVPEGKVISQTPAARERIDAGSTVDIEVSKGPEKIATPDVSKMTLEEAGKALEAAGLTLTHKREIPNEIVPKDTIVDQSPKPGDLTAKGSGIMPIVSSGTSGKTYTVCPDVAGKSEAEARAEIEKAGLNVEAVTKACSATVPAGSVMIQTPRAGANFAPNIRAATVNLVCAIGLLAIGLISIAYGRLLIGRNKNRS